MVCIKCGNEIENGVPFCPNCGTKTNAGSVLKPRRNLVLKIIFSVLSVTVIFTGIWIFIESQKYTVYSFYISTMEKQHTRESLRLKEKLDEEQKKLKESGTLEAVILMYANFFKNDTEIQKLMVDGLKNSFKDIDVGYGRTWIWVSDEDFSNEIYHYTDFCISSEFNKKNRYKLTEKQLRDFFISENYDEQTMERIIATMKTHRNVMIVDRYADSEAVVFLKTKVKPKTQK